MEYGVLPYGKSFTVHVNKLDHNNVKNFHRKNLEFGSDYFKVYDIPFPVHNVKNIIPLIGMLIPSDQ
jgi:hypothetical protein